MISRLTRLELLIVLVRIMRAGNWPLISAKVVGTVPRICHDAPASESIAVNGVPITPTTRNESCPCMLEIPLVLSEVLPRLQPAAAIKRPAARIQTAPRFNALTIENTIVRAAVRRY